MTDAEFEAALRRREEYREQAAEAMAGLDLLVTPTLAFVAPPAVTDDLELREAVIRFTYPFNALGWPALALPCGPAEDGLPASVQLVAPPGEDARVLAAGALLEPLLAARRDDAEGGGEPGRLMLEHLARHRPARRRVDGIRHANTSAARRAGGCAGVISMRCANHPA